MKCGVETVYYEWIGQHYNKTIQTWRGKLYCLFAEIAGMLISFCGRSVDLMQQGIYINTEGFGHTAYDDAVNTGKVLLRLIANGWKSEHYFAQLEM